MVDAADLKSATFAGVWVRVPLPAPTFSTPEETVNRGGLFVWLLTLLLTVNQKVLTAEQKDSHD